MLTETQFYDRLAAVYDTMNDWQARLDVEMPFILAVIREHGATRILDCACGTGSHAIALAEMGFEVAATDVSPQMIERAKERAKESRASVSFQVARIRDLGTVFQDQFDTVLCLGNTFPHIISDEEARGSLSAIRSSLRPEGIFIMQGLNYDKRWKERPRWFAVNHGELGERETLIWRFADYGETLITFNIALFTHEEIGDWSVNVQSTLQRPYQKREFETLLTDCGFHDIAFYGNLQGAAFEPARSPDLIVIARA